MNVIFSQNKRIRQDALARMETSLEGTGWGRCHVDEARQILQLMDGDTGDENISAAARSKAQILSKDRYFDYWYFEGAPLSVQIALAIALDTGAFVPAARQERKCEEFLAFFRGQLAFKRALNWSETVGGWLFPGEAENLWKTVQDYSATDFGICEIGSWTGRSTTLLGAARAHFCPGKPLHAIDDWNFGGQPDLYPYLSGARALRLEFEANTAAFLDAPTIHEAKFQDFAISPAAAGLKFDLVFHDAGHTVEDFERDLPLLAPLLAPDATLLIHDYVSHHFSAARQVIDQWVAADSGRSLERTLGSTAVIRIGRRP
ncbi:class I SAM-dependent methyltransferase [Polaromonas sp.]|uniref:class I SAM-dependent methyltransferase n=1 Tax=Polaromonas sp. TaxID=1869339 RepID=UPI002730C4BB|nr:class I SAM-dependent methyltransferase [Polaromonas sp.]MDP1740939.1 class I SAM-dependent methyltransferase [Polaromonas sp.]